MRRKELSGDKFYNLVNKLVKLEPKERTRVCRQRDGIYSERNIAIRYNLSRQQYEKMYKKQGGECAICESHIDLGGKPGGRTSNTCHIDHDHETGFIRGLLCPACNQGLGQFEDNPEILYKAMNYVLKSKIRQGFKPALDIFSDVC